MDINENFGNQPESRIDERQVQSIDSFGDSQQTWNVPPSYDAAFEDSIMKIVLNPDSQPTSLAQADYGESIQTLPSDAASEVSHNIMSTPIPLNSPLRIHPSPISSFRLTHPYGHPYGGPTISSEGLSTLAESLVREHDIRSREQMQRFVLAETRAATEELERRMNARRDATERNAKIRREIQEVIAQREVERRMEKRALEETVRRREKKQEKEKARMLRRKV